ncbi:MAG: MgtC/SapB family protein [Actinomycetaceae bacterium]|nr:MgtC/SapB family protein [Actinomycetaceae bacterium]
MFDFLSTSHLGTQLGTVTAAFVLCSLLGLERNFHQKNAGVKTHVLVGVGACMFTLVSAYGFAPVLGEGVHLDPARIAAQIVSGIGFLGAGVIFVNNDIVRGLTTAATVWLSAAMGMACGASMIPLATYALVLHYLLVFVLGPLANRIPATHRNERTVIEYDFGRGIMRSILVTASSMGYTASVASTEPIETEQGKGMRVVMRFDGPYPRSELRRALEKLEGVHAVDVRQREILD